MNNRIVKTLVNGEQAYKSNPFQKVSLKKLSIGLTGVALSISLSAHSESFTARNAGQGFTSITHDFTSALSNPALLNKFEEDDDVFFSLNLGGIFADEYDVVDAGDRIADNIDQIDQDIANIPNVPIGDLPLYYQGLTDQVDVIIDDLEVIDNKPVYLREGFNALIIIPNKVLSTGLFVNQYGRFAGIVDYAPQDEAVLNAAILSGNLDTNNLLSEAVGVGYSVLETGVMVGYEVIHHVDYDLNIGAKVKYQRLDLFYNTIKMADFDDDDFDLTDDDNLTDENGFNVDLGMYVAFGEERQWQAALVLNDIAKQEVTLEAQNLTFELEMLAKAGISYQTGLFTFSGEVDLTDRPSFKQLTAPKYASLGVEVDLWQHLQLRAGARKDLNDKESDMYTLGVGFSPWDVVAFDIAGFTGDNDNVGAALQISVKI